MENKKRNSKGLSLIEASMVLALSAIVISGVMMYFQSASENQKNKEAAVLIHGANNAIQTAFNGNVDYDKLASNGGGNIILNASSNIPDKYKKDGKIINPWGGSLSLVVSYINVGGASVKYVGIRIDEIPKGSCATLGMLDLGDNHVTTKIHGGAGGLNTVDITKETRTPSNVSRECEKNNDKTTIMYGFK